jgi:hypothetical protein
MKGKLAELAAAVFDGGSRPGVCGRVAKKIIFTCLSPGAEIGQAIPLELIRQILKAQQRAAGGWRHQALLGPAGDRIGKLVPGAGRIADCLFWAGDPQTHDLKPVSP